MTAVAADERQRFTVAFAALVLGAVAMGASVLFVRWADVGPYASAFWRVFLALPFLWVWMRLENGSATWPRLDGTVLLAGLLFTGDLFFWHLAILGTTVANATTAGSCDILNLVLGPLHLNVLGLVVDLNQVVLHITAQSGAGNLLGNLLCAVAGLLDGSGINGLATLLNRLLGL